MAFKVKYFAIFFILLIVGGYVAFTIPILPDPYYHETKVTFAEWLKREIDELLHGEKE